MIYNDAQLDTKTSYFQSVCDRIQKALGLEDPLFVAHLANTAHLLLEDINEYLRLPRWRRRLRAFGYWLTEPHQLYKD